MVSTEQLLKDFVLDEPISITIDNREFKYKKPNSGDQNRWLNEIVYVDKNKQVQQDNAKLNLCRLENVVEAPYNKEVNSKVIGVEKDWKDLSKEEKKELFEKLDPTLFSKLIVEIKKLENRGVEGDIKNP